MTLGGSGAERRIERVVAMARFSGRLSGGAHVRISARIAHCGGGYANVSVSVIAAGGV